MAVIENDVIKVTVSNSNTRNVIQVSPGVSALSSVSLSLNDLNNVNTSGITNGQTIVYDNGSFVAGDSGAVETINGEAPDSNGDVTIDFSVDGLTDVDVTSPSVGDILKYETNRWVNDSLGKSDVGLANVDNTSDADKPISTATQTALDVKANTSSVPASLTDLSDVSIVGTPSGNQALIYDATAGAFKSQVSYTNRFEDEVETGKDMPSIFAERAYSVKGEGDGVFIDPESDTPSAGNVIVRKIYHKTGFITDADVIGDYTLIHTFADDTAYADTVATFEGFEDGATYGVPPFTLLQTWEEVTAAPAFTGLLNETYGSGAEAAYSVRRLNGNYTGAAIQVERSSDNSYQDIGFDANGDLDESALTTFCTGTTCKVRTWYGQEASGGTGSGNDAQQTDHTKQPTIYTGGAIVKVDGKPAIQHKFGGTSNATLQASLSYADSDLSIFCAYENDGTANQWLVQVDFNINLPDGVLMQSRSNELRLYRSSSHTSAVQAENKNLGVHIWNGSNLSPYLNGVAGTVNTGSIGTTAFNFSTVEILSGIDVETPVHTSEIILYTSDKSTDRTQIESNVGDYFTQNTPLLDTYSGAAACYSLRLMRTAYTGSAIRVRRDNNDEQDIGFNVFGELDTVSLLAFAGASGNAWVKIWYDQSTNGNDATQSVATNNQPQIVSGGAVIVDANGKPIITRVADYQAFATPLSSFGSNVSVFMVTNTYPYRGTAFNGNTSANFALHAFPSSTGAASSNVGTPTYYVNGSTASISTAGDVATTYNGIQAVSSILSLDLSSWNSFQIGTTGTYRGMYDSQEFIIWDSPQSSNRTNIEDNINTFYSIY